MNQRTELGLQQHIEATVGLAPGPGDLVRRKRRPPNEVRYSRWSSCETVRTGVNGSPHESGIFVTATHQNLCKIPTLSAQPTTPVIAYLLSSLSLFFQSLERRKTFLLSFPLLRATPCAIFARPSSPDRSQPHSLPSTTTPSLFYLECLTELASSPQAKI